MSVREELQQQVLTNPKIAAAVSASTMGTGAGTYLNWIPGDIGKLATVIGIILSCVLIYTHLRKFKIEMIILKEKEAERLDRAAYRKRHGEPIRRQDDS